MPPAAVQTLLSRIANDADFRDWLAASPDEALAGHDLTDDEARLFRDGGAAAAALLSYEARGAARPAPTPVAEAVPATAGTPLEAVSFLLQVLPTPQDGAIAHLAGLHPPGTDPAALQGAVFALRLAPLALPQPDGSLQVRYTATVDPVEAAAAAAGGEADTAVPTNPWGHDTTSPTVRQAADAVHAAPPGAQRAAIEALIRAMTEGAS